MTKEIDYLTEDKPLPGQNWVCLSFLSPEGVRNCKIRGVKVRGVFSTKEEADKRAKDLQEEDPDFHIFVGEVGKWLAQDPDPNSVPDQEYREKELNKLMKDYKASQAKAKAMEAERKSELLQDAIVEERNRRNHNKDKTRDRLRRKLEEKKVQQDLTNYKDSVVQKQKEETPSNLQEKEETAKQEQQRIQHNEKAVEEAEKNVSTIDQNINKIQELYDSLVKKRQASNA
jgi:DNA repair exonuclease SbcCD ATPase subunit